MRLNFFKSAYTKALAVAILLLTIYYNFVKPLFPLNLLSEKIICAAFEFILFSSLEWVIYEFTCFIYSKTWRKSHKDIWVEGIWLSIHEKEHIRVGTVEISQTYYSITATGNNITPNGYNTVSSYVTNWTYLTGIVAHDKNKGVRDYIACYSADKDNGISNNGLHMLNIVQANGKGFPIEMSGRFSDVFKAYGENIDAIDPRDHCGKLYLFKLVSEPCKKFLMEDCEHVNLTKLAKLHLQDEYKNEPYVKK